MDTSKSESYLRMSLPALLQRLRDDAQVGSQVHAHMLAALQTKLTMALVESIDNHERAASRLSNRLLWLNVILGVFTVLGTVLAVVAFVRPS